MRHPPLLRALLLPLALAACTRLNVGTPPDAAPADVYLTDPAGSPSRRPLLRPSRRPRRCGPWGTGLLVGAGVCALGGAAAWAWREATAADFNAERARPCLVDPTSPDVVHGAPECRSLRRQTLDATVASVAGFVAAGALAAGGLALLLAAPRGAQRAGAGCVPGLLSVTCGLRF